MAEKKFTRRKLIVTGVAAAGAVAAGGLLCSDDDRIDPEIFEDPQRDKMPASKVISQLNKNAPRPNIIVILTDDMGYADPSCYGGIIETPQIDKLAREGMRFTDFYCSSPLCSPSRIGLLTGRYPLRAGVVFPLQPGKDTFMRKMVRGIGYKLGGAGIFDMRHAENMVAGIPQSEITIPEALKLTGYRTGAIGKWHLGDFTVDMKHHPRNHGFDFFTGFNASNDDWPVSFWKNEKEQVKDIGIDQGAYTGIFTREAISFIEGKAEGGGKKDDPFFLYLAHKDPHQPCIPSKKFEGSSKAGPHGDTVKEVDWSVGEIMKALKRNGLDKNTLVIFTSDNGPWFDGSPGKLRGRKGESFDGGYRVPMIARWAGKIPAGTTCREPSMNIDFFPTAMSLAGLSLPKDRIIDGKNIMGLLSGKEKKSPHESLYFFHYDELEGVRAGRWKYFRHTNTRSWPIPMDKPVTFFARAAKGHDYKPEGSEESVPTMASFPMLYDMKHDPGENYNVAKRHPRVVGRMKKQLADYEKGFFKNIRGYK